MKGLTDRRDKLSEKLAQYSVVVRGSITSVCARCNRANCICRKSKHHRAYRLTYKNSQQISQIVYVPRSRLPEIKRMINNYSKLRKIVEELIEINIQLFKSG
jgi:hypothetical protein